MARCTKTDLLLRLREIGVRHIFGVPGDYQLEFLDQVEAMDGIEWIGNCNVGAEVDRYHLGPQLINLVERIGCPVSCLSSAKGVFPEEP